MGFLSRVGNRAAEMVNAFVDISNGNQQSTICCGGNGCQGQVQRVYTPPRQYLPEPPVQEGQYPVRQGYVQQGNAQPVYVPGGYNPYVQSQPYAQPYYEPATPYYHGSSWEGAMDIFHNNRVMVGSSSPRGFWVTDDLSYAKGVAGNHYNGGILKLYFGYPDILENINGDNIFYVPEQKLVPV